MPLRRKKTLIDHAAEFAESVLPALERAAESAKETAAPLLADAKDKAAPLLADGKALAAEKAESVAAAAQSAAASAKEAAKEKAPEKFGGEPKRKRGGFLKKLLVVGGLAALAAFVAKRLRGEDPADNWQSSYVPAPPPAAPAPTSEAAPQATDDTGGAGPDEAVADAVEEPHPVTTPDDPAEVVDVEEEAERPTGTA